MNNPGGMPEQGQQQEKEAILTRKSLSHSIKDGACYSLMVGFGESFFSAYAVFLRANTLVLGALGTVPTALRSILQIYSERLIAVFGSRKRAVTTFAFLEALMYLPILLAYFVSDFSIPALLIAVCSYWVFSGLVSPIWSSWMGDLVSVNERGSYFGRRNKINGIATLASMIAGGFILRWFGRGSTDEYLGFVLIFSLALVCRIISVSYLMRQYEPAYNVTSAPAFSFRSFLAELPRRNFGRFTIFSSVMNFGVFISGPFYAAYMLYDLHFGYLTYTIISAVTVLVKVFSMPVWGRAADRYGTRKVLVLSSFLIPSIPMLWLFSSDVGYLIAIQLIGGLFWAGYEIASFNFLFDSTSPKKRVTCLSYYNVLVGLAALMGGLIGGLIARHNALFWSSYFLVFIISSVVRFLAAFLFVTSLKEVRAVEHIPYRKLFYTIVTTMPSMGIVYKLVALRKRKKGKADEEKKVAGFNEFD